MRGVTTGYLLAGTCIENIRAVISLLSAWLEDDEEKGMP